MKNSSISQNEFSYTGQLSISGFGAKDLLQGQLTCDLDKLTNEPKLGAQCNRSGKVISVFLIYKDNNIINLNMPKELAPIAHESLKKYAQFYPQVIIKNSSEEITNPPAQLARIKKLIPAIYPETSGMFFTHELNLAGQNAVSLDKGCYTGQEIIARMHYKGKQKTKLKAVKLKSSLTPNLGNDIFDQNSKVCGRIVDAEINKNNDFYLLVIVPIENNGAIFIDKQQTQLLQPLEPGV